ncbi:MAG: MFS transporter [Gammaproteobacteria bacterium]|nr:MFS transporter [Gammaproteobacteria bacterium]
MSTIVAVRKRDRACIAADSLTTFGSTRQGAAFDTDWDKIQRFGDTYIGVVGSAAHHHVVRSLFRRELQDADFRGADALFETFRRAHAVLKEKYYLNPKDSDEDPYESSQIDALVVNAYGVFGVYSLREVYAYERFWAIGSGEDFALGAMQAVYDREDSAETIARIGIEVSAELNNATALPMSSYAATLEPASR